MTARHREAGLSLAEVLVAMAILAVTMTTALLLYDDTRRAIKRGENRIDQQQVVRIAYDRIGMDLRMAGFNYNPDGEESRPDEQIEAAYDTAIVVRADLDFEDPVQAANPETALAGGAFDSVSIGNDEIVAYVLAKPDGTSTDVLTFQADVSSVPRDGVVEVVSIPGVSLILDDPPYTLYRVTLNNDVGTFGSADFFTRTPLAENVRSLTFRYLDKAGAAINSTFDLTSTSDDIGGDEIPLAIDQRAAVRRIQVDLVGQTRDPDVNYHNDDEDESDREDEAAGIQEAGDHRRFRLRGDVSPRNIGMRGLPDLFAVQTPPSTPGSPNAATGHCEGLYVSWTPNPPADDVEYYKLLWGSSSGNLLDQLATAAPSLYLDGLNDATDYFLAVQAVDSNGNPSALSGETYVQTDETTQPTEPQNLLATLGATEQVDLTWEEVTTNDDSVPGDPASPLIRELDTYSVYREDSSSASISESDKIGEVVAGVLTFTDTTMVHCQDYFYTVKAVDRCSVRSSAPPTVTGRSFSTVRPLAPVNVEAFFYAADKVRVAWQSVIENENGDTIYIDNYRIYRTGLLDSTATPAPGDFSYLDEVTLNAWEARQYIDTIVIPAGKTLWYKVTAVDRCPNESVQSIEAEPQCSIVGSFWIEEPDDGDTVNASTVVDLRATPWTGPYERLKLEFTNLTNNDVHTAWIEDTEIEHPGNRWLFSDWSWVVYPTDPYRIDATLYKTPTCSTSRSVTVFSGL